LADIRSAWEIAQEKASKLGGLSAEEREEQRHEKCRVLGQALADKYLGQHNVGIIEEELRKYETSDKDLIGRAAAHKLSKSLDLRYPGLLVAISKGILALENTDTTRKTLEEIKALFQEYEAAEAREREEIEKAGGEILHQMRISGSAISQLNIRAKEEWVKKLDQAAGPFTDRLESLKQKLLH
jgi:hypothetical protein